MTTQPNPMLDAILERLATKLAAADPSRDLAPHINRAQVARDLALLRLAAGRETPVGFTPQARRETAEAVQRINEIMFDSPDAPAPETIAVEPMTISLERSVAELADLAGRWLERADTPQSKV